MTLSQRSNDSACSMADAITESGRRAPNPSTAERAAESADPSPILVTYDVTETEAERKARVKSGKPAPTYSFMVTNISGGYRG